MSVRCFLRTVESGPMSRNVENDDCSKRVRLLWRDWKGWYFGGSPGVYETEAARDTLGVHDVIPRRLTNSITPPGFKIATRLEHRLGSLGRNDSPKLAWDYDFVGQMRLLCGCVTLLVLYGEDSTPQ
jgi:hypothetical protein